MTLFILFAGCWQGDGRAYMGTSLIRNCPPPKIIIGPYTVGSWEKAVFYEKGASVRSTPFEALTLVKL